MTRNYDKFCKLFDERIIGLKRAVEKLDRKNLDWHSYKIEGMLDAAESILNIDECNKIHAKYGNYDIIAGMNKEFCKMMDNLYGEHWR